MAEELEDGSERVDRIIKKAISWDVLSGVARRSWARNEHAVETAIKHNKENKVGDHITIPYLVNKDLIKKVISQKDLKKAD
jgi:urocanate hydratase